MAKSNPWAGFEKKLSKPESTNQDIVAKKTPAEKKPILAVEPLMSNQLSETQIRQVFDKISIPAVWKGLADLGYTYINSDAEKLTISDGKYIFQLVIKPI